MKEINQIVLDLKRKIFKPIYFLFGEEAHYIDVVSNYIEQNVLDETEKEFNQHIVYGRDVDLTTIIGLAKQFPMMGDYNVVIVKEAQNIKELSKKEKDDTDSIPKKSPKTTTTVKNDRSDDKETSAGIANLIAYINNPQPTTILVFCYKYKSPDKRSAVIKAFQKNTVFVETKKLYDNQVPDWVTNYVKDKNYTIGPKASFLLAEFLGNDLSKISNEIDKLLMNLAVGKEITIDIIQDNIGISKDYNVFELQDALGKRDILKANRIIQHFAGNEKENPAPVVLANLYSYFCKILKYHYLPDKNKYAVASSLGVSPFFVDSYIKAAQTFPVGKLKLVFSYLKDCDLKSKGVNNPSLTFGELLKELVYKMLH